MKHPRVVARPMRRALWAALIATAAITAPAAAWDYPLLPHIQGLALFPETPSTEYNTFAYLSAVYPGECWRVVDSTLVDSAHVSVTIRRSNDCGTDSVSYWQRGFYLGFLAAGMHELTVTCIVLDGDLPPTIEEITVPFEVVQAQPPPPPPPPYGLPLLEQIQVTGAAPNHPVTLTLNGFKPFECTLIHHERVVDQMHVEAMFDYQATCEDTTRRWSRSFDMGVYPIGVHEIFINLWVFDGDSLRIVHNSAVFEVRDPNEPPPVDSTTITVHSLAYEPPDPTIDDEVTLRVKGSYPPALCGQFEASVRTGDTIQLWMRPVPDCTDTVRAFEHTIALGKLPAGDHPFTLQTIWAVGGDMLVSRDWPAPLHVRGDSVPPPPGVDSVNVVVHGFTLTPKDPNQNSAIKLKVRGSFPPYFCGRITNANNDSGLVLIMEPVRDCNDTTRAWEYTFNVGKLPAGDHRLQLTTSWRLWGSTVNRYWPIEFSVRGTGPSGPPPDSLQAALSPSKPNPFSDESRFAVSLADPTEATVAVYDLAGRLVSTIHRGTLPRGTTFLAWNGRRQNGERAPQGIYFYQLTLPGRVVHRRVVLLDAP